MTFRYNTSDLSSYDEPTEAAETEEPDHTAYGYPAPDIDQLVADLSPKDTRELAKAALLIMAELGQEIELSNAGDHCVAITDILTEHAPDNLPTITAQSKPAARWWCDVLEVDRGDDIAWTPEEEA